MLPLLAQVWDKMQEMEVGPGSLAHTSGALQRAEGCAVAGPSGVKKENERHVPHPYLSRSIAHTLFDFLLLIYGCILYSILFILLCAFDGSFIITANIYSGSAMCWVGTLISPLHT